MADLYKSRFRMTYVTRSSCSGASHKIQLCDFGGLLTSPVTFEGAADVQRSAVIGSRWMHQRGMGNASVTCTFSVATIHEDTYAAESYGEDLFLFFLLHPVGQLIIDSSPDRVTREPRMSRRWTASRDKADPTPMTGDKWFGGLRDRVRDIDRYAWLEMGYQFTLSSPLPELPSFKHIQ